MIFIKWVANLLCIAITRTNLVKNSMKFFLQLTLIISFGSSEALAKKNNDTNNKYDYNTYNQHSTNCGVYDPYEAVNRKIFAFNAIVDTFLLRPIAKGYGRFTNDYTKNRVESFIENVSEPLSTINYTLQGDSDGIFKSFWRFTINSTFGLAGMFDVASKFGLNPPQQTLGNTLAHYGVGPGPYIVLPLYGGISARDASDPLISNNLLNPANYAFHKDFKLAVAGTKILHTRSKIMPFSDYVSKNSPDPYIAIREAIFNSREAKIIYPNGYRCPVVN